MTLQILPFAKEAPSRRKQFAATSHPTPAQLTFSQLRGKEGTLAFQFTKYLKFSFLSLFTLKNAFDRHFKREMQKQKYWRYRQKCFR